MLSWNVVDVPEHLTWRMYELITAVAQGHESIFLLAEANHLLRDLDNLPTREVKSSHDA